MLALAPEWGCTLACSAPNSACARSMARSSDLVDELVAAVVALARVALRVLVGEDRPDRPQHGRRREVLAGDELDRGVLPLLFARDDRRQLVVGIDVGRPGHQNSSSSAAISASRCTWRPPSKGVVRNVCRISSASPKPTTRAPIESTLASLCARANRAVNRSLHSAALTRPHLVGRRAARPGRCRRARCRPRPRRRAPPGRRPSSRSGSRPAPRCACRRPPPRDRPSSGSG